MTLSGLIYNRLITADTVKEKCASIQSGDEILPAVFEAEAPPDTDPVWGKGTQYPRIIFAEDMQANEERSSAGTLTVTVYVEKTHLPDVTVITAATKQALRDVILNPEGEDGPFAFAWARTDAYALPGTEIVAQISQYDIVEYPDQTTTDPDPQDALARFIKSLYGDDICVLGIDRIDDYTDSRIKPVLYVEVTRIVMTNGHCVNSIVWLNTGMQVHVICPDHSKTMRICGALVQKIGAAEEIIMIDNSPMTINGSSYAGDSDYLRFGQITVNAKYGVLKTTPKNHTMRRSILTAGS